jgi:hypothetical protein
MSISYAAFCQVLLVADASDHVSDVGETTDQSSAACDASCHVSSVFATSVHVSAVPAIGSHFSMPLAVMLHTTFVEPPLDCTRFAVATFVLTHGIVTVTLTTVVALADVVTLGVTVAAPSLILSHAAVLLADAAGVALASLTRCAEAVLAKLAADVALLSRTR